MFLILQRVPKMQGVSIWVKLRLGRAGWRILGASECAAMYCTVCEEKIAQVASLLPECVAAWCVTFR